MGSLAAAKRFITVSAANNQSSSYTSLVVKHAPKTRATHKHKRRDNLPRRPVIPTARRDCWDSMRTLETTSLWQTLKIVSDKEATNHHTTSSIHGKDTNPQQKDSASHYTGISHTFLVIHASYTTVPGALQMQYYSFPMYR